MTDPTRFEEPSVAVHRHCELGENPLWDDRRKRVLWEDIDRGRIYEYDPATGQDSLVYEGPVVGGFTMQEDGSLLLFRVNEIAIHRPGGETRTIARDIDADMRRFNDVIADPEGRVFAGTIGQTKTSGGLYRVDLDGKITRLFQGTGTANGMGFTPDLQYFYWTCSTTGRIFRFRYDRATGELRERTVFNESAKTDGTPDGMAVDAEGCVWTARWGGWAVQRYAPDGRELAKIKLPVQRITSVAFGGEALDTLYITTAGGKDGADTLDGALFTTKTNVRGQREFRSRIQIG